MAEKKLTLVSWNVNGLRAAMKKIIENDNGSDHCSIGLVIEI
ncbi:MAG: hypothetical protein WAK95_11350 [Desulfobacterales bacterium]